MYTEIARCRICGNEKLLPVLSLGTQHLTGVFPRDREQPVTSGPLELVLCSPIGSESVCGLLQLRHSYDLGEMYGENYGYRSGLNESMVRHLQAKVAKIVNYIGPSTGDLVLDVGSNDGTLLRAYPRDRQLVAVGIDPTGVKFSKYYPAHVQLLPHFFSADLVRRHFGQQKAKVITSISMFYDLEAPLEFVQQIRDTLADDGVWCFEQSYMPTMLEANAYDTICHEHLEYYSLRQVRWMCDRAALKIIDVELNDVNGGSFSVMVSKNNAPYKPNDAAIDALAARERALLLDAPAPYEEFKRRVFEHRDELRSFVHSAQRAGRSIVGYGASTKGNVLLQFCGFTAADIPCIAEVNEDKFGAYTPGTLIPIVPESEARALNPDYFMVLPWHFRDSIIRREQDYMQGGGKLLFPLPSVSVLSA